MIFMDRIKPGSLLDIDELTAAIPHPAYYLEIQSHSLHQTEL
jgi:hypothetical protein